MSEISDRYQRLAQRFADTIAAVPADRWEAPSPCEGWSAREVVRHVVGTAAMFEGFVGRQPNEAPSVDDDPAAAWEAARAQMHAELTDPATAQQEYEGLFGTTTFENSVDRFLCADLIVHRWDLAKAAGGDTTIPAEDVARGMEVAKSYGPAARSPGVFGPEIEVPDDADAQTKFLAFTGRRA